MEVEEKALQFFRQMGESRWARVKTMFLLAVPYTISLALDMLIQMVSLAYTGRLSDSIFISGIGLAVSIVNVVAFATLIGFAFAHDQLGSQAVGAGNFELCGDFLNQGRIILFFLTIATFPIFIFSGSLLALVGVEPALSGVVTQYMRIVFAGVILKLQSMIMRIHFKAQRITWPTFFCQTVALVLHFGWLELFSALEWGFSGICVATLLAFSTEFVLLTCFLYCLRSLHPASVQPFRKRHFAWSEWRGYFKVGCSNLLLMSTEWWAYEIMNISVTYLGPEQLATQAILSNTLALLYLISLGFGSTLTTLIGNSVGDGDARLARQFFKEGLVLSELINVCLFLLFYLLSSHILPLFTRDEYILELGVATIGYVCLEAVFDGTQCLLSNSLRGLGMVKEAYTLMMLWQWLVYVPIVVGVIIILVQQLWAIWVF